MGLGGVAMDLGVYTHPLGHTHSLVLPPPWTHTPLDSRPPTVIKQVVYILMECFIVFNKNRNTNVIAELSQH